jgi:alkaline phosphatase D
MSIMKCNPVSNNSAWNLPMSRILNRRDFLSTAAAGLVLPALAQPVSAVIQRQVDFAAYPFSLGVASGEPSYDGFVIWTRLAPKPLDGGGMPNSLVEVSWEVAEDDAFSRIVRQGTTIAAPQLAHAVHVELMGLKPDRWYWYRFQAGKETSPFGKTRTLPAEDAEPDRLRFAFASCQHYEDGYYAGYANMLKESLDLIIHLGDYIYEGAATKGKVRQHVGPELQTLDQYRNRYAQYRTDPDLQAAHADCPWVVTWDDHEFADNYANLISEDPNANAQAFVKRRADAYQAFYEHMPLRRRSIPRGHELLLYRKMKFGRLAEFFVLDTRQYRTDQPNGDGLKPLTGSVLDPAATILGARQKQWLMSGLLQSQSTWNVIPQQVLMARVDRNPGEEDLFPMDKWAGYDFERQALMDFFHERKIPNPIVLSGDIHTNYVNELKQNPDDQNSATVGVEFVGTSISSGGNGTQKLPYTDGMMAENPFIKFHNAERGYVTCTVKPGEWRSDYWVVEDVTRRDSAVLKRADFVMEDGKPGIA